MGSHKTVIKYIWEGLLNEAVCSLICTTQICGIFFDPQRLGHKADIKHIEI